MDLSRKCEKIDGFVTKMRGPDEILRGTPSEDEKSTHFWTPFYPKCLSYGCQKPVKNRKKHAIFVKKVTKTLWFTQDFAKSRFLKALFWCKKSVFSLFSKSQKPGTPPLFWGLTPPFSYPKPA